MKCRPNTESINDCVSAENDNAIGFSGYDLSQTVDVNQVRTVTATYKDNKGRVVYEVIYTLKYSASDPIRELYLHETYYRIDMGSKSIQLCRMQI